MNRFKFIGDFKTIFFAFAIISSSLILTYESVYSDIILKLHGRTAKATVIKTDYYVEHIEYVRFYYESVDIEFKVGEKLIQSGKCYPEKLPSCLNLDGVPYIADIIYYPLNPNIFECLQGFDKSISVMNYVYIFISIIINLVILFVSVKLNFEIK